MTQISSNRCSMGSDGTINLGNLCLTCNNTDVAFKVYLSNYFHYHERHGDDINNLNIYIVQQDLPKHNYSTDANFRYRFMKESIINKIKLYGQHRTRVWSEHFIHEQELIAGLPINESHADELFTIEIVRIICEGSNQDLYLRSIRNFIEVERSNTLPDYFNWLYTKEELDMNFELQEDSDYNSSELVYKKHYEFE